MSFDDGFDLAFGSRFMGVGKFHHAFQMRGPLMKF
jgi:hypothetical protein